MDSRAVRNLILLSGGLDSAAALFARDRASSSALFVDYGQVTRPAEEKAARRVAALAGVPLEVVRVPDLARLGAGSLAGGPASASSDGQSSIERAEWFPARNLVLIALAAVPIGRWGGGKVLFGATPGVYRDNRAEFYDLAGQIIAAALPEESVVVIDGPQGSRPQALSTAMVAGLDPRITFSCNRRPDRHCWRCSSCRDRAHLLRELDSTVPHTSQS